MIWDEADRGTVQEKYKWDEMIKREGEVDRGQEGGKAVLKLLRGTSYVDILLTWIDTENGKPGKR